MALCSGMKIRAFGAVFGRACAPDPIHGLAAGTFLHDDTLSSVARRNDCPSAESLARANGLRSPYVLRTGQQLKLTGCG